MIVYEGLRKEVFVAKKERKKTDQLNEAVNLLAKFEMTLNSFSRVPIKTAVAGWGRQIQ